MGGFQRPVDLSVQPTRSLVTVHRMLLVLSSEQIFFKNSTQWSQWLELRSSSRLFNQTDDNWPINQIGALATCLHA